MCIRERAVKNIKAKKMLGHKNEMPAYLLEDEPKMLGSMDEMPVELLENHNRPRVLAAMEAPVEVEVAPVAPVKKDNELDDYTFTKKFYHTLWDSSVKGWYGIQKRENVVSNECMGDWMDEGMDSMNTMLENMDDYTFPKADEIKTTFNFGTDLLYKNFDKCDMFKVASHSMTWCSENVGQCMYGEDFMARLKKATIPILIKGADIYHIMTAENYLIESVDSIQRIGLLTQDFAVLAALLVGFKGDFNSEASAETFEQLQMNVHTASMKYQEEHPRPKFVLPEMGMDMEHLRIPHMGMPPMKMPHMHMPHMPHMPPMPHFGMPPMPHFGKMEMPTDKFFMNLKPKSPFGFKQSAFGRFSLF